MASQLEVSTKNTNSEYLNLAHFVFEYAKKRVRKVHPKLVLLLCHFSDFLRAAVEHDKYDDDLDV